MILPIFALGQPVLRRKCTPITAEYPALSTLIDNMFETMYHSKGVGIAAPQIGIAIRLFIIDATPFAEDEEALQGFKKTFINAQIIEEKGEKWAFNEGCLSIPNIREDVERQETITISYQDENFVQKKETFSGLAARIIQHEYDHIEGKLFIDYLSTFKKTLLKNKLDGITKGRVNTNYKMKFAAI